jgi:hypothetical protein
MSSVNDEDLATLLAGRQGARFAPAQAGTDALVSLISGNELLVREYVHQKRNALLARLQNAPLPASVFNLLIERQQQQQQQHKLQALFTLGAFRPGVQQQVGCMWLQCGSG